MSSAETLPIDPFCSAADPARYVARAATEAALAELRAALDAGPGAIAFTGPDGLGKSMLLRVLETRLAQTYTFVCLQATPPSPEQVCEAALHALGDAPPGDAAGALALRAALLARRGRPLVLALDAAEALASDALAELAELPLRDLRLLVVASERDGLARALAAFGPALRRVTLDAPLSRSENEEYLEGRLEHGDAAPELRSRVLAKALELWRASRGNPQRLHAEVSQLQLDLWRATAAEPRLRLVEPEPAPRDAAAELLQDLEIDAAVAPVPTSAAEPLAPIRPLRSAAAEPPPGPTLLPSPAAPPIPVAESAPPPAREQAPPPSAPRSSSAARPRTWTFAWGALCGALLTAVAMNALAPDPTIEERRDVRATPAIPERDATAAPASLPAVAAAPATPEPVPAPPEPSEPALRTAPTRSESPEPRPTSARSGTARIQVQALPWATIYIDGELVGETPLGDLPVRAGVREFRAEMPDGRTLRKRVAVEDGTRVLFQ